MDPSQQPLMVEPYQPLWVSRYEDEAAQLCDLPSEVVQEVQHFGSTSVPGMSAKPTVDILLGTTLWPWPESLDTALEQLGYIFYKAPNERWRVYLKPWLTMPRGYHLHVVEHDSDHWRDHLLFRDYLRTHSADAERYASLKQNLAGRLGGQRGTYQYEKGELVRELMRRAKAQSSQA
jgi:GrpB-like predicted nucleotidyltransferase (UPF0157 family)